MIQIEKNTIGEAHDAIMRHLLKQWVIEADDIITTEDSEKTIESHGMTVRVLQPWKDPKTSPALQFGAKALEAYIPEMTGITRDSGFEYTYGNRLFDYPFIEEWKDLYGDIEAASWMGDGDGYGINQIRESITNRLINNPTSRRAMAVTWVVMKDMESKEPPCLQFVQCLIRDGCLNLHAVFRSHDMAGGWGPNVYALEALQKAIINGIPNIHLKQGYIETYSVSAHIYVNHDQVKEFRRYLNL